MTLTAERVSTLVIPGTAYYRPRVYYGDRISQDRSIPEVATLEDLERDIGRLVDSLGRVNKEVAGKIKDFDSPTLSRDWNGAVYRINALKETKWGLHKQLKSRRQEMEEEGEPVTCMEENILYSVMAGASILLDQALVGQTRLVAAAIRPEKIITADRRTGYSISKAELEMLQSQDRFENLLATQECLASRVKIGDYSIGDFFNASTTQLEMAKVFRTLVEAYRVKHCRTHDQLMRLNSETLAAGFPVINKVGIELAGEHMVSLAETPTARIFGLRDGKGVSGEVKEAVDAALRIKRPIERFYKRVQTVLFSPGAPEFNSLRDVVEAYLSAGEHERIFSMLILGMRELAQVGVFYRRADAFSRRSSEGHFYSQLAGAAEEWIDHYTESLPNIYTVRTLKSYFVTDPAPRECPDFTDLDNKAYSLWRRLGKEREPVDPNAIDLNFLQRPNRVTLKFNPGNHTFGVDVIFAIDGAEKCICFEYVPRKKSIDWGVAADINIPEMIEWRRLALHIGRSALDAATARLDTTQRSPIKYLGNGHDNHDARDISSSRKTKKEKGYKKPKSASQPENNGSQEVVNGLKYRISFSKEEFKRMTRGMGSEMKSRAARTIKRINQTGHGDISPCSRVELDGNALFKGRIGDQRMVLVSAKGDKGQKGVVVLKLVDIGPRDDIYVKWGITSH